MIFTREELDNFNIEQLRRIAKYFNLKFTEKTSKGRLIEKIYYHLESIDVAPEGNNLVSPPASVRIRRIRENQKGA